jgi:hypothetical protein
MYVCGQRYLRDIGLGAVRADGNADRVLSDVDQGPPLYASSNSAKRCDSRTASSLPRPSGWLFGAGLVEREDETEASKESLSPLETS